MATVSALSGLTVLKLKERCRELGIPVGGKKAELIARIESKLSAVNTATTTILSAPVSQNGDAHVLFIPGTATRTSKATTKRKIPAKNPSYAPGGPALENRSTKRPKSTEVPVIIPGSALSGEAVFSLPSDFHNTTVPDTSKGITSGGPTSVEVLGPVRNFPQQRDDQEKWRIDETNVDQTPQPISTIIATAVSHNPRPHTGRALNPTASSSIGRGIIPRSKISPRTPNRTTEEPETKPAQPRGSHGRQRQGNLKIAFLETSSPVINSQIVCDVGKRRLPLANQRKEDITSVPINTDGGGEQEEGPNLAKGDKPSFSGLDTSFLQVRARDINMGNNNTRVVASRVTQGLQTREGQSLVRGIITPIIEAGSDPDLGLLVTGYPSTSKAKTRSFKRLEPINHGNTIVSSNIATTTNSSPETTAPPPPHKQDHEILASIIRNPPRYSLRRQVEKIARALALVAFYGFSPHTSTSVPGDFLRYFSGLSRNYRYASTLAFTYLVRLEFPGKRTQHWFRNKRVDEKVADVRLWYWHRVSGRAKVIERVRTSWVERVWRFLVLASVPGSTVAAGVDPGGFGLWFNGIGQHLLADPDLDGQFETAIRFWIRRFYVWVTKNGGGYPLLLQDLRDEMVQEIRPLDGAENQDLWRVEVKCSDVYFIVGMTGEVVGWAGVDGTVGNGLESVQQRRTKTRVSTMVRGRAGGTLGRAFAMVSLKGDGGSRVNIGNITWEDLREDWRQHASALVSFSPTPDKTHPPPQRLIESVYRPDAKTVSHGIHESVKLPQHRALAERWVLAQVEPGGISGKPVLEAIHGVARRREKLALDLQAKLTVESVRCAGEKWISSKGILAQGVGFVQTPGMGWFVLEETGQNIAQEEYGIQGLWATVLGVDENGVALGADELEGLADMFVWKNELD